MSSQEEPSPCESVKNCMASRLARFESAGWASAGEAMAQTMAAASATMMGRGPPRSFDLAGSRPSTRPSRSSLRSAVKVQTGCKRRSERSPGVRARIEKAREKHLATSQVARTRSLSPLADSSSLSWPTSSKTGRSGDRAVGRKRASSTSGGAAEHDGASLVHRSAFERVLKASAPHLVRHDRDPAAPDRVVGDPDLVPEPLGRLSSAVDRAA